MPLSNLLSFHQRVTLQNASAFPGAHYASLNNLHCINAALLQLGQSTPIRQNRQNLRTHTLRPLDAQTMCPPNNNKTLKTPAIAIPNTEPKTEPKLPVRLPAPSRAPSAPRVTAATHNKRIIWKPGRGGIEKVDKLSGEIMHMAEACS